MFPVPWSSKWSWSLHLFFGRPMFLRPFGLYIYISNVHFLLSWMINLITPMSWFLSVCLQRNSGCLSIQHSRDLLLGTHCVSAFKVLSVLLIKDQVLRDMTLSGLVNIYRPLGGTCSLYLQPGDRGCKVLRVLANIYWSIQLHIS